MAPNKPLSFASRFDHFSTAVTKISGKPVTFILALLLIVAWAASGPLFGFSETWQLVINTGTTIITFLMVFVIQQSQNKDTVALHLKLNELIASSKAASNRLVNVENLTEAELDVLKQYYCHISDMAAEDKELFATHSIDEAKQNQDSKLHHKGLHKTESGLKRHAAGITATES